MRNASFAAPAQPVLTGTADLHMHTTYSDGLGTPKEVLDFVARFTDLDVIAITDHDVLDGSLWAVEQQGNYPFEIVPGMEVTSRDGHVLALWVTQLVPKGLSLAETCEAIHEQGGMAILAHPFEPLIAPVASLRYFRHPEVLKLSGVDAVEIMNAGAVTPGGSWLARKKFESGDLPVTGSSDAHMPACVGTGITRFAGFTAHDLRQSLAVGTTQAEGRRWAMTVYLQHWLKSRQMRRNASLAANV